MTATEKNRLECEQYGLEIEIGFWQDQQQKTKDEMYWHYAEGRIAVKYAHVLNEPEVEKPEL